MHRMFSPVRRKRFRQAVLLLALLVAVFGVVSVMTETFAEDGDSTSGFPFPRRGPPRHSVGMIALDGDPDLVLNVLGNVKQWAEVKRAFTAVRVSDEEIDELGRVISRASQSSAYRNVQVRHIPTTLAEGVLTYELAASDSAPGYQPRAQVSVSEIPASGGTADPPVAEEQVDSAPDTAPSSAPDPPFRRVGGEMPPVPPAEDTRTPTTTSAASAETATTTSVPQRPPRVPRVESRAESAVPVLPFARRGTPRHRITSISVQGVTEVVKAATANVGNWGDVEKAVIATVISDEEIREIGRLLLKAGTEAGYTEMQLAYYPQTLRRGVLTYSVTPGVARPVTIADTPGDAPPVPDVPPAVTQDDVETVAGAAASQPPERDASPPTVSTPMPDVARTPTVTHTVEPTPASAATVWSRAPGLLPRPAEVDQILFRGQDGSVRPVAPSPVPSPQSISDAGTSAPPPTTVPETATSSVRTSIPDAVEAPVGRGTPVHASVQAPTLSRPPEVAELLARGTGRIIQPPAAAVVPAPSESLTPDVRAPVPVAIQVPDVRPAVSAVSSGRPAEVDQILARGTGRAVSRPVSDLPTRALVEAIPERPAEGGPPAVAVIDLPTPDTSAMPAVPDDAPAAFPALVVKARDPEPERTGKLWWPFARGTASGEPIVTAVSATPVEEEKPRTWWPFSRKNDPTAAETGLGEVYAQADASAPVPVSITLIPDVSPEAIPVSVASVPVAAPDAVTFPFPRKGTPRHAIGMIAINGDPDAVLKVLDYLESWNEIKRAFTSTPVSDEEINELGRGLLDAAQRSGYVFVDVRHATETLREGVLTYEIYPGEVGVVQVRGNRYYSGKQILRQLGADSAKPFNYSEFRDNVKGYSVKPDIKMDVTLDPKDVPGQGKRVDIGVTVEDSLPLHGGVEVSSTHRVEGDARVRAWLQHVNLTKADDELTVQATVDPNHTDQMEAASGSYRRPIGQRHALTLYGGWAKSYLPEALPELDVFGNGHFGGLRLSRVLKETPEYLLSGSVEWLYQHSENKVHLANIPYREQDISLSMPRATLSYVDRAFDRFGGRNSAAVSLVGNVAGFAGSSDDEEVQQHMAEADGDILIARAEFARLQKLFDSPWSIFCRLDGQYTPCTLVPVLQKAVGGADELRGYMAREVTGDSGVSGTLEFRTPLLRDFIPGLAGGPDCGPGEPAHWRWHQLQFLTFFDFAFLHRNEPLIGLDTSEWLSSAGVGLRLGLTPYSNLSFDYGIPLQDADDTDRKGRSSVSLRLAF